MWSFFLLVGWLWCVTICFQSDGRVRVFRVTALAQRATMDPRLESTASVINGIVLHSFLIFFGKIHYCFLLHCSAPRLFAGHASLGFSYAQKWFILNNGILPRRKICFPELEAGETYWEIPALIEVRCDMDYECTALYLFFHGLRFIIRSVFSLYKLANHHISCLHSFF